MWRPVDVNLPFCLCLSRPDLLDYPVPPVPVQAACNYAKSHVPGNANSSPPVEHEYHSIDVNYKRVYAAAEPHAADRMNGSGRLPANHRYVSMVRKTFNYYVIFQFPT